MYEKMSLNIFKMSSCSGTVKEPISLVFPRYAGFMAFVFVTTTTNSPILMEVFNQMGGQHRPRTSYTFSRTGEGVVLVGPALANKYVFSFSKDDPQACTYQAADLVIIFWPTVLPLPIPEPMAPEPPQMETPPPSPAIEI